MGTAQGFLLGPVIFPWAAGFCCCCYYYLGDFAALAGREGACPVSGELGARKKMCQAVGVCRACPCPCPCPRPRPLPSGSRIFGGDLALPEGLCGLGVAL